VTTVRVNAAVAVCAGDPESVAWTVNDEAPVCVGVPEICPPALRLNPAGNDPDTTDHVYGAVPPTPLRACEYAEPTVAAGNDDVSTTNVPWSTVMPSGPVAVCGGELESVAWTVNDDDPVCVGVPEICPPALRLNPAGNDPDTTDHVYGGVPPDALNACE